jgi:hypothetical protein
MKEIEKATPRNLSFFTKVLQWYVKNPILVYTMGKVGSSSIVSTLREYDIEEVQPHSLTLSRRGSYFVVPTRSKAQNIKDKVKSGLLKLKGQVYFSSKRLMGKKIKIVTLTRDPLARTISAYFEQYQYVLKKDINQITTRELIDNFHEFANHKTPHIWFDNEIRTMLGTDVYSVNFDKELGCGEIETNTYNLLIVKMEKLSSLEGVLANYFNVKDFQLKSTNRSEYKVYKEAYDKFKQEVTFSKAYLDFHYNSKYAKHFYTEDELTYFRKRWVEISE